MTSILPSSSRPATAVSGTAPAPADVYDLDDWKLQLPIDASGGFGGSYTEVRDLDGYSSAYFYTARDGAMVLAAPVEGATTGGSTCARSELREMNGGSTASWTLGEGGRMVVAMQVDEVPREFDGSDAKVCIGQIHDGTYQLARLYYDNGTIYWVNGRNDAVAKDAKMLLLNADGETPSVGLDETFTYSFDVQGTTLVVSLVSDGETYTSRVSIGAGWSDSEFYFKAGVYLNTNETNSSGQGQVSIYGIDVDRGGGGVVASPPPPQPTVISDGGKSAVLTGTSGSDVFSVGASSTVVRGGGGDDLIRSTVSWTLAADQKRLDLLGTEGIAGTGGAGDDTITGNGASNRIKGNGGADTVKAGDGDDFLYGNSGNDSLDGGSGADSVSGSMGNDVLVGGAGNDLLGGGVGQDRMTGGDGADTFSFNSAGDSRTGAADLIIDFTTGVDRIDLGLIDANSRMGGNQAFVWGGTGAGQLILREGHLLADLNGDGRMDFDLDMGGRIVVASDLIL